MSDQGPSDGPAISPENEAKAAQVLKEIADIGATVFFEKPLTASDTSGSGRVVIPKAVAEQYFPKLEQPSGMPVRAVDTRGHEYNFKFRFWVNNQSRMYLLEGAGELHRQFTMAVGDVMVFAQKPDRSLVVAGRPATKNDVIRKPPVKRPAAPGDSKPAKAGKDGKSKAVRTSGSGGPQQEARKRLKSKPGQLSEVEPPVDGVFRAVPHTAGSTQAGGITEGKGGRWVVTLNLANELYQAFFDTEEDAHEAFNAAGGIPFKLEDPEVAADAAAQASQAADAMIAEAMALASEACGTDIKMEDAQGVGA